jgi:hypothetical protein
LLLHSLYLYLGLISSFLCCLFSLVTQGTFWLMFQSTLRCKERAMMERMPSDGMITAWAHVKRCSRDLSCRPHVLLTTLQTHPAWQKAEGTVQFN